MLADADSTRRYNRLRPKAEAGCRIRLRSYCRTRKPRPARTATSPRLGKRRNWAFHFAYALEMKEMIKEISRSGFSGKELCLKRKDFELFPSCSGEYGTSLEGLPLKTQMPLLSGTDTAERSSYRYTYTHESFGAPAANIELKINVMFRVSLAKRHEARWRIKIEKFKSSSTCFVILA